MRFVVAGYEAMQPALMIDGASSSILHKNKFHSCQCNALTRRFNLCDKKMMDSVKNGMHTPHTQTIRWRWWLIALGVLALDFFSKLAVQRFMPYGESIPLTGFFNFVHVWNTGAAFSFLANAGGWQRYFFLALAIGASIWLASELHKGQPTLKALAYSVIMGGALGNGVDRALRGYVVDYLDFHVGGWHWPAFNIADIGIFCGAALIILAEMRQKKS